MKKVYTIYRDTERERQSVEQRDTPADELDFISTFLLAKEQEGQEACEEGERGEKKFITELKPELFSSFITQNMWVVQVQTIAPSQVLGKRVFPESELLQTRALYLTSHFKSH